MKKIDIGQIVGILANVGVLIGIFVLVYELSLNRQMMQSQTRTALAQGISNHFYVSAADSELSNLVTRAVSGGELTADERSRYFQYVYALFRYYENVHYQYRIGLYDEREFAAQRRAWEQTFTQRESVAAWCRKRQSFSPDFVAEIDGLPTTLSCP